MPTHFDWISAVLVVLVLLALQLSQIHKRSANSHRIEAKLDLLLKQAGLSYDLYKSLPATVADALDRGEKIAAIREHRKATGPT